MNIEAAREQMIEQQVHAWDVFDERVLTTMRQVPRELFAPARYRNLAFADAEIPLLHGQSMLPAKVHGRILQALAINPADVALEIGAGSGYLTACMGKLAARVRSLEIFRTWLNRRARTCSRRRSTTSPWKLRTPCNWRNSSPTTPSP
jgi:protein-L-isoaspartate(D-aspartate) O-methyltransferase